MCVDRETGTFRRVKSQSLELCDSFLAHVVELVETKKLHIYWARLDPEKLTFESVEKMHRFVRVGKKFFADKTSCRKLKRAGLGMESVVVHRYKSLWVQ